MDTTPYWIDTAPLSTFPKLDRDLSVDVVVIGGGITGITAAYLLQKAGAKVALLERHGFVAAETGHTTAHLTYVTDLRLQELVKTFGRDHAQAVWDAGDAAIQQIHEIARDENLAAEFAWVPGYLHAPLDGASSGEHHRLEEGAQLARDLGFEAAFTEHVPILNQPGVRFANQAKFHPRKYLAGLLSRLASAGVHLFQESPVEELQSDPLAVKANGYTIRCGYIVIATHVPLQGLTGTLTASLFQTKLAPYTTYAVGAPIPAGLVPEASFWDTADPYYYLRIDRQGDHDYAILGGADHKTGQTDDPHQHFADVEKQLLRLIPSATVEHRWSGQVVETNDGLPFIGEIVPKQFIATGFAGNGMTFGTLSAIMAADAIAGRSNPWAELFSPDRKKIRGGTWDYLRENKDYPFYLLKEWFTRADAASFEEIKPGEGKVVQTKKGRLAAYRSPSGQLTVKSAVCTHMGCVVRWNPAETTWDCPCHGSRFSATGDVLAGPAETPLSSALPG